MLRGTYFSTVLGGFGLAVRILTAPLYTWVRCAKTLTMSPDKIIRFASGHWAAATLAAAVVHSIFTHIDGGRTTPEAIAQAGAGSSSRGARALCDGLAAWGCSSALRKVIAIHARPPSTSSRANRSYLGAIARRALAADPDVLASSAARAGQGIGR